MSQSLLPPMCFEGVVFISKALLVLFTRADPLCFEKHHPEFSTKAQPGASDSLEPIMN